MDVITATKALTALGQESRLRAFRLLIERGSKGMPAGDIARKLKVPHNTLSAHLSILSNAGLVRSQRAGRSIIYGIDFDGMRDLLAFLMEDCCRGKPELCAPVLDRLVPECCAP